MVNKNIMLESLTNEDRRNREREEARAFVKEFSRIRAKRLESEISLAVYFGASRPHLFDSAGDYFLRRNKDNQAKATQNPIVGPCKTKSPWL